MLLCLAGCGEAEQGGENISFAYNGIQIRMGAEAGPILEKLGAPKSYTESPSCAFEGLDKTYYYGSFYLSTSPLEGGERVDMLWFADDSVATEAGIRIGSGKEQVEQACGAAAFDGSNSYVLTAGESRLVILLEDERVSSIRYELCIP